jgi:hypothetical protein
MGVGGMKGSHGTKVREALDLVTISTGLLNSHLRMIIMENPKDMLNLYREFRQNHFLPNKCLGNLLKKDFDKLLEG